MKNKSVILMSTLILKGQSNSKRTNVLSILMKSIQFYLFNITNCIKISFFDM